MIDVADIHVQAGDGGAGRVSFRRMKFMPKGGPDGGDGGRGGSVYFVADKDMNTLQNFMSKQKYAATPGEAGGADRMHGANGEDIEIKVPVGTIVSVIEHDKEIGATRVERVFGDMLEHGQRLMVAKGGFGGRGNDHFKGPTNQTPQFAERGTPGQRFELRLELKLLANVGLVGFPNAGKSSLLAAVTNARPEIANYPFTTISPNLGVLADDPTHRSVVLADIPGLIEGAGSGKGLGHEFLKHVERCSVLLFVLSIDDAVLYDENASDSEKAASLKKMYDILQKELASFHPDLVKKPTIIGVNKLDLYDEKLRAEILKVFPKALLFSAATHEGLDELKAKLLE
jgi:GTP-binding protein